MDFDFEKSWVMKSSMRSIQEEVFDFVEKSILSGCQDIVLETPTGSGKSAMGLTIANAFSGGGYYLVTQKMLQDQIMTDKDLGKFKNELNLELLKSSDNYECKDYSGSCSFGKESGCDHFLSCTYNTQKMKFIGSSVGLTNYAFLITEYLKKNEFLKRKILILDEAHNIESTVVSAFTVNINKSVIDYLCSNKVEEPSEIISSIEKVKSYLKKIHNVILSEIKIIDNMKEDYEAKTGSKLKLQTFILKRYQSLVKYKEEINWLIENIIDNPHNFIYTLKMNDFEKMNNLEIKPIFINDYAAPVFNARGEIRIYLSAFLGDRDEFCEVIGKESDQVKWLSLDSLFPVENRMVYFEPAGKISHKFYDQNIEKFIDSIIDKCDNHKGERGIIHCHSYKLGTDIFNALKKTEHASRVVFPKSSKDREIAFEKHLKTKDSIIISPSMTEGYDFKDDFARWQVIAKVPFANIADPWVERRKLFSQNWYASKTTETIVQAAGRVCRHEKDFGVTYILDSDFLFFYNINKKLFPKWFRDSLSFKDEK